jgi:hypothetical protein
MKKIKIFIEWCGWEFIFFALAAIIGISLILKTVSDFLNTNIVPQRIPIKLTPVDFQNAVAALLLTQCIYKAHKHQKRKRKQRLAKGIF